MTYTGVVEGTNSFLDTDLRVDLSTKAETEHAVWMVAAPCLSAGWGL